MTVDQLAQVLNLLVAIIFPVLVGLVTTKTTNAGLKAIFLAGISFLSGVLSQWLAALTAGVAFDLFTSLITGLGAFVVAVAAHYGFWRPTGVTARVQAIGDKSGSV